MKLMIPFSFTTRGRNRPLEDLIADVRSLIIKNTSSAECLQPENELLPPPTVYTEEFNGSLSLIHIV